VNEAPVPTPWPTCRFSGRSYPCRTAGRPTRCGAAHSVCHAGPKGEGIVAPLTLR